MTICKRVTYSGRVQGVGFRYTAQHIAAGFAVTGYVRNLSNGNVELVAEGENEEVEAFLEALGDRMKDYIQASNALDEKPGGYRGFTIRH